MSKQGFSFAAVVISYFLVAGGIGLGLMGFALLEQRSEPLLYASFGVGGLIGGLFAGRASRHSTIVEPALGALLLIGSLVALIAITPVGKFLWEMDSEGVGKVVGLVGGSSAAGALIGAFLSERIMGEATRSSLPWLLYSALATLGACFAAWMVAVGVILRDFHGEQAPSGDTAAAAFFIGIGGGCLLSGLSIGAQSRTRALLASLVGSAAGTFGFFTMVGRMSGGSAFNKDNVVLVLAVIAAGGGIVTLIGNAIGWIAVGRHNADA